MTREANPRADWSSAQDADFAAMWDAGRSLGEIAQRFGVSREAASAKATRLRRSGRELERRARRSEAERAVPRRCLGCERDFMSSHSGNRLCWSCSQNDAIGGLV